MASGTFMTAEQRRLLTSLSELARCNPFLPERIELERQALGDAFEESELGLEQEARPGKPERRQDRGASGVVGDDVASAFCRGTKAIRRPSSTSSSCSIFSTIVSRPRLEGAMTRPQRVRILTTTSWSKPAFTYRSCHSGSRTMFDAELPHWVRVPVPGSPRVPPHLRFHRRELATCGAPSEALHGNRSSRTT